MEYIDLTQFKEKLSTIQEGDKITLVKLSEFGYPITIKLKFELAYFGDYAQYKNCLYIQGKQPRKRKSTAYRIKPYDKFALYLDHIDIADFTKSSTDEDGTTTTAYGTCFDYERFKTLNEDNNPHYWRMLCSNL